ncbi:MAG: DUF1638 domain-containing protein [Pseudomonadales bacterium]
MADPAQKPQDTLIIACGAIAKEIEQIKKSNGWSHLKLQCLPAELHNRPEWIPDRLREAISKYRDEYDQIFVGYADCGTGGEIDKIIAEYGLERLPGPHCYSFFSGQQDFLELADQEPGTLYLTDFLTRHFDRLMIRGLKIDKHPELEEMYFANYRRLVYLAQTDDQDLQKQAQAAADRLKLEYVYQRTGYGELQTSLESLIAKG